MLANSNEKITVTLVFRAQNRTRDTSERAYYTAVSSPNGRVKPLIGMVNGKATHLPDGVYYLRYRQNSQRVWEKVGTDLAYAA